MKFELELKIMTRREIRIVVMQALYTADFNDMSMQEALSVVLDGKDDEGALKFLEYINTHLEKIDGIISSALHNYSLSRLNLVDKAIIRLATAELLMGETDKKIIINEALEITKEYSDQGDHKAASFNNKLLDNITKII